MNTKIFQKISLWLPVVLWAILIFNFSSGRVPSASDVYWQDFAFKKTGHILLFGSLAALFYRALIGEGMSTKKAVITAIILATIYGATDEFHQSFTQGREAAIRDIFIDGFGAYIAGIFVYHFLPIMPKEIKMLGSRMGFLK